MSKNKRRSHERGNSAPRSQPQQAAAPTPQGPADESGKRAGRHPVCLMAAAVLLASWLLFLVAMAVAR